MTGGGFLIADSVTHLGGHAAGCMVVCGSHGGTPSAAMAYARSVRAVIFSDAGVGRDRAGIAGLDWLESRRVPAAAVAHTSARIGDGADLAARGVISHANRPAMDAGVRVQMTCAEAIACLESTPLRPASPTPFEQSFGRYLLAPGPIKVWALDSASDVEASDSGAIVVTGSHGGLLGGRAGSAVKAPVVAAVYNDAGIGIDDAGVSRLPALEAQCIAGAVVAARSARIGDGRSTYTDGVLSVVNAVAARLGARAGMTTAEFVATLVAGCAGQVRRCV